jgi:hypothetical protein
MRLVLIAACLLLGAGITPSHGRMFAAGTVTNDLPVPPIPPQYPPLADIAPVAPEV